MIFFSWVIYTKKKMAIEGKERILELIRDARIVENEFTIKVQNHEILTLKNEVKELKIKLKEYKEILKSVASAAAAVKKYMES